MESLLSLFVGILSVIVVFRIARAADKKIAAMPLAERQRYLEKQRVSALPLGHGSINPALICPHCQEKGNIRTKRVKRKKGVSGAKATGALLTNGLSILATGLSRKEHLTQAYCGNCQSTWDF